MRVFYDSSLRRYALCLAARAGAKIDRVSTLDPAGELQRALKMRVPRALKTNKWNQPRTQKNARAFMRQQRAQSAEAERQYALHAAGRAI